MVKSLKVYFAVIVGLLSCLWFLLNLDTQTNIYSNKESVLINKAIIRGWIPSILPNSAYKIKETHNIDTNEISGEFKYLEKDENSFLSNLRKKNNMYFWKNYRFEVCTKLNEVKFYSFSALVH